MSEHNVAAHYGVRTHKYKLIHYYGDGLGVPGARDVKYEPQWELFDLEKGPYEMNNVYDHLDYQNVIEDLKNELYRLKEKVGDYD